MRCVPRRWIYGPLLLLVGIGGIRKRPRSAMRWPVMHRLCQRPAGRLDPLVGDDVRARGAMRNRRPDGPGVGESRTKGTFEKQLRERKRFEASSKPPTMESSSSRRRFHRLQPTRARIWLPEPRIFWASIPAIHLLGSAMVRTLGWPPDSISTPVCGRAIAEWIHRRLDGRDIRSSLSPFQWQGRPYSKEWCDISQRESEQALRWPTIRSTTLNAIFWVTQDAVPLQ